MCSRKSIRKSTRECDCAHVKMNTSVSERLLWSMFEIMLLCVIYGFNCLSYFSLSVTDPESELVAPAIVMGPKDTTVVAGSEATLECIANAR